MKRFLKPILTAFVLILALGILASSLTYVGQAAESVTSGSCGENLVWNYDTETQTLTISGTGEMEDYTGSTYASRPWNSLRMQKLVVEEGVTTIGDYAFYDLYIYEISLPESLLVIGEYGFSKSGSFSSIHLPNNIHTIEEAAFRDTYLESVIFPENLRNIGTSAFADTDYLKEATLNHGLKDLSSGVFYNAAALTDITLNDDLETIGSDAFCFARKLGKIALPESLRSIGEGAFSYSGVGSIVIPGGVETVSREAFYWGALQSATLMEGVKTIEELAFGGNFIKEISIPASVSYIHPRAFVAQRKTIQKIVVAEDNPCYTVDEAGVLYTKDLSTLLTAPLTISGDYVVPDGVTVIAEDAFSDCKALTGITFPPQLTTIGEEAFAHCEALREVHFSDQLQSVGVYAFYYCTSLKSIELPDSLTTMGLGCFDVCRNLENVTLPSQLTAIPNGAFRSTAIRNITIPEGVTTIGYEAFEYTDLEYVMIPASVEKIGYEAFADNPNLRGIYFKGDLPTIGVGAFHISRYVEGWLEEFTEYSPIPGLTLYYLENYPAWEQYSDFKSKALWDCDKALMPRHTLNVESDLSVNYAVKEAALEGYDMDTVYMECILDLYQGNDKTGTKTYTLYPEKRGDYYYFTLSNLTAVQMKDQIRATVYGMKDGAFVCSPKDTYSIADYAYKTMSKTGATDALKTVCADILRYGATAQIYKGYRTDALADAAMTEEQKSYLSDMTHLTFGNTDYIAEDLADPAVLWVGKALNLEARVAVKYIFTPGTYTGSVRDLTLKVRYVNHAGQTVEATLTNPELYDGEHERYAFTFDGLLAAELRTVLSAQIYSGDGPVSATLVYSPDTYGNGKTDTLGQLCKALFAYSDSVKTYFGGF